MFNAPFIGRGLSPIIFGNSGAGGTPVIPAPSPLTAPSIAVSGNDWTVTPGTYSGADSVSTVVRLGGVIVGLTGTLAAGDNGKTLTVDETATNAGGTATQTASRVMPYDALAPYYASGTIGIHFATDAVTTNAGGQVTGLRNKGALGAAFNATVSGEPIAISGNALNLTSTSGTITTATAAALSGVRLMFVVGLDQIVNGTRFFGHVNGAVTWDVHTNTNASGLIVQGRYVSGTATVLSGSPRILTAATGFALIEVEFSATQWLTWINGTATTGANASVPEFYISTVGTGTSGARMLGAMGDVAGVLTGRADTAAAIAALKTLLNQKFGTPA
ncbi:hypothetical protein [Paracoccus sulfuroxidans]|uniref:Concanavalin A-like lectin/glucanase superfamily protein n=1 Tax=Paracoccus sulfuroxidans TaxID=384678 RepID=A0A562NL58_9RHOB|nr:hypothetical protein [Paracoccus sulfuroxidans]TWI32731.1 hypothetical protein IQ24_02606 [Paracoccus sulfuroxidans]